MVTTPSSGENGFTIWGQQNPFNDVLVEEPSYGSSNGILELEGTGSARWSVTPAPRSDPTSRPTRFNVAPLDAARSSRAPKLRAGGDYQGLNFVAYAEDAVSYLYWTVQRHAASTDAATCLAQVGARTSRRLSSS